MSQPAKLLIVDDEELIRLNLGALLEDLGYPVTEAADGREGLDAFDREQPDLVLADLMMPVMDGLSMIAGLREKSPETPVIVISGTGSVRDAVDSLRLGAWDYVLKPVTDAEGLDITIKRALERARLLRENRRYREHLEELVRERTEEIRESEAFLNTLLDAIPIPVFYKDRNGRYLGFNRAFETFYGATRERLIGKTVFDANPRDLAEIYYAKNNELFESGGVLQYESQLKNAHGQLRDVIFNKSVLTDSQGAVSGLVGTILDITDRKRMENVLRESEERFRTLTEKSLVGVYIIQDDLFRYVNPAFAEIHGYEPEEIIDRLGPVDFLTPEDRERVLDSVRRRTAGEIEFSHHEFHIRRKDGSIRIVEAFGSRALHQGCPAVLGTIIDSTERKRSEEKLFQITERWKRTFDAVPDPIMIVDTDFRIVQVNKAMADRLGSTPEECEGQVCYAAIHKTEAPPAFCPHSRTLRDCRAHTAELSVERLGGDFIVSTSPICDTVGQLIGSVHVASDITSLRKAEGEQKLLEAQLHQAQKMEAIGQLAGGIAHDFNNILTAIIGYGEIILMRMEKDSQLRHFVEQVLTSADRAAELTNGLLAFSRRQVLHAKPIDLCGVVRGLKKMLRRLLPEDIDFRTTFAEGNLIVMADKGQIEQVLMNLVTNAKDAMPRGGTLTIEVSPAAMDERFAHAHGLGEPGNYACISVTDTGHGMDEETTKRVFEPFFTTKEVGKGTGLGMAIVYGIIQQHNGCITVSSETGKGTTFRIYLPLIVEEIKEVHGTRKAGALPGGTETVLLAEDEVTVRELHKMILEGAGYRIVEAVDGQDALDKFMEHMAEVDIVVTDVVMPKTDGKSLYEEIRKIRPDMKVLFMSGYTKDIVLERGIRDDEFSYVTKPVKSFELLKKVRDVLDRD
jgi:two-component system cell cycle sensor histidine kinase/response regulator CckA